MVSNHKLKERRKQRIQSILAQETKLNHKQQTDAFPVSSIIRDEKWQDPEYVWKQQQRAQKLSERPHHVVVFMRLLFNKLLISFFLFVVLWGMFQLETPWAQTWQEKVQRVMSNPVDFSRIQSWYTSHFSGFPSLIPAMKLQESKPPSDLVNSVNFEQLRTPISGQVVSSYSSKHPMIHIAVTTPSEVFSIAEGRVMFAGESVNTGLTILLQHRGGLRSIYGGLSSVNVQKDDWVEVGEVLGLVDANQNAPRAISFSLMVEDQWINPLDVISFE